jgi:hypothetical protein
VLRHFAHQRVRVRPDAAGERGAEHEDRVDLVVAEEDLRGVDHLLGLSGADLVRQQGERGLQQPLDAVALVLARGGGAQVPRDLVGHDRHEVFGNKHPTSRTRPP